MGGHSHFRSPCGWGPESCLCGQAPGPQGARWGRNRGLSQRIRSLVSYLRSLRRRPFSGDRRAVRSLKHVLYPNPLSSLQTVRVTAKPQRLWRRPRFPPFTLCPRSGAGCPLLPARRTRLPVISVLCCVSSWYASCPLCHINIQYPCFVILGTSLAQVAVLKNAFRALL